MPALPRPTSKLTVTYSYRFRWLGIRISERRSRHRHLLDRLTLLNIAIGRHTHLELLVVRVTGAKPEPFLEYFVHIKQDYVQRLPD